MSQSVRAYLRRPLVALRQLVVAAVAPFVILGSVKAAGQCPLAVGNNIMHVDPTGNLNVRSCYGTGCSLIGTVPPYATGIILDGPQSASGYVWWRIRWDSSSQGPCLSGWSAEGDGGTCWLEATWTAMLLSPAAGASINFPQQFSWGIELSEDCSNGRVLAFATSASPSSVYTFSTSSSSYTVSQSEWTFARDYLGQSSTYYWTIGDAIGGYFYNRAPYRSFSEATNPVIEVTPASLNFGDVQVGQSATQPFTVRNVGTGTLSGSASGLSAPFSFSGSTSYSLGAGQQTTIQARFAPTAGGSFNDTVDFSAGGGASRSVSGNGISVPQPVIEVTPASLNFGAVQVGQSATQSFTIRNVGTGTLSGSASGLSAPFSFSGSTSYSLGAGQQTTIQARFAPTAGGSFNDTVDFSAGGGASRSVSGNGAATPQPGAIHLRLPWTSAGDSGSAPRYWRPSTYTGHLRYTLESGAGFAVDFFLSNPLSCERQDEETALGEPVRAAHGGQVTVHGPDTAGCNPVALGLGCQSLPHPQYMAIEIEGMDMSSPPIPVRTRYIHLTPSSGLGSSVSTGDIIGYNDHNGCTCLAHLHFEVDRLIGQGWVSARFDTGEVLLDGEVPLDSEQLCPNSSCAAPPEGPLCKYRAMPRSGEPGGSDDDGDGQIDEGADWDQPRMWYRDADFDGYGNPSQSAQAVQQPSGYVANDDDCDDSCASCHPAGTEVCDGRDNDCDGQVDEGGVCEDQSGQDQPGGLCPIATILLMALTIVGWIRSRRHPW